jgi:hypothetical protein
MCVAGQLRAAFPFPALATLNKEVALKSAQKLRGCQPAVLAVGHGNLLKNPVPAMDKAIMRTSRKIH